MERIKDLINIESGAYAPLKGFLRQRDFLSVLSDMRLADGNVWPVPIVLDIDKETAEKISSMEEVSLLDEKGDQVGLLKSPEVFSYSKRDLAEKVFGTDDLSHPGVAGVFSMEEFLLGGEVKITKKVQHTLENYFSHPERTKDFFKKNNWKKVVAFQTRNIPHRGHEFLQKEALRQADGLLIQPVVGKKKQGDFLDEVILGSYKVLIEKFFPDKKALLSALPLEMRYAGPREAVFHALIRRNYGCTHFIIGRDHAGVGDFYSPFAAQEIFDNFDYQEIGVEILKFSEVVFDYKTGEHCFIDESEEKSRINFSGTKLREFLVKKEEPPEYMLRPEIYQFLINHKKIFVENEEENL